MKVGDIIKDLRRKHHLTQAELAKKLNVAPTAVSAWERNENRPLMDKISILANLFDVPVSYFFDPNEFSTYSTDKTIPLIGTICAGDGLLAEQNIEEYIYYPFPHKRQPDYALLVKGDSMIGAGIEDGDIVYLRKSPWAEYNGQIVAALINDNEDGTLKRMKWTEGSPIIQLIPENDDFDIIEVMPNEVTICGVYMGHFKPEKKMKRSGQAWPVFKNEATRGNTPSATSQNQFAKADSAPKKKPK